MAKLYYFNGRGRAEICRLTLAAAGINFSEEFITEREVFLKYIADGKLLFEQIPMLEIDGKRIVQSGCIVRFLANKAGLKGKTPDEELLIDQYYEGGRDFFTPTLPLCFMPEKDVLEGPVKKALSKYLPIFEKIASANETCFLVGNSLTIADLSLLETLLVCDEYMGEDIFKDYPAILKFYKVVTSLDRIAKYLNGPQRKRKNDERYVRDVKHVLDWN